MELIERHYLPETQLSTSRGLPLYCAIAPSFDTGQCIDVTYPADNNILFEKIIESGGAIATEHPIGARPEPWRFPARNRLITRLSLGVLVVESPIDSGSMIAAREAGEQGGKVFAIPGPIDTGPNTG